MKYSKRFLIKFMYLGFRYHGIQKQTSLMSIQSQFEAILDSLVNGSKYKMRFSSRTDAKVSSLESYVLLMFENEISTGKLSVVFANLPADIKVLNIEVVDSDYSLQKNVLTKTYHYSFSFGGASNHPFLAPHVTHMRENLDIDLMIEGAKKFEGFHDFSNYAYRPKNTSLVNRSINSSEIELSSSQFYYGSKEVFIFKVNSSGFLRGQIRLMMGALFRLGLHEITLIQLEESLHVKDDKFVKWLAPASGLLLTSTKLK